MEFHPQSLVNRNKNRIWIGLLVALLAVGVLIAVLTWALQTYAKPFVADKISEALSPDAPALYEVQIDDLSVKNGATIFLNGLSIIPDTAMLASLDSAAMPPKILWLDLPHFEVSLKSVVGALFGTSTLNFDGVLIQQAKLKIREIHKKKSTKTGADAENEISIKGLIVEDLELAHQQVGDSSWSRASLKHLKVSCDLIRTKTNGKTTFNLKEERIDLEADHLQFMTLDGLYSIRAERLQAGVDTALRVVGFRCEPQYSKNDFQQHIPYQSDRIEASIDEVSLFGLAWDSLLNSGSLQMTFAHIGPGELVAYRDRNTPFDESRRPSLPVRLIRELPMTLHVDSLRLDRVDIEYQERPEGQQGVAVIPFNKLSARFYNITNRADRIATDSLLVIRGNTLLFGNPTLSAEFRYNLKTINGQFSVKGTLAEFDMPILNKALEPLMGIPLESGQHERTTFFIHGNDFSATGKIEMYYHTLSVSTGSGSKILGIAKDALAKSVLYYKENPKNGDFRIGTVDEERDPKKFVFNYWWLLYKSGVKSSVLR